MGEQYPILLVKDGDGYFSCHPDLPGCMGQGATPDEAVRSLDDGRPAWIEAAKESGMDIPEPCESIWRTKEHDWESIARELSKKARNYLRYGRHDNGCGYQFGITCGCGAEQADTALRDAIAKFDALVKEAGRE